MTRLKKLTALLVSAALALSLLAGCGGSKALSQVIADLLSGMYNNVTVEVDPDLTAALKKASAAGSTQEEVLAALVEELNLSGVRLTLRQLQEGRQGDRGVELVFQSGADPDAAARSAVNGWASAFGALPDDGSYTARVAMIEAEGGYYIAVDVEVLKAGTPDKDDPEPKPDYTYDEASNTYTVYTAAGLQKWAEAAKADPSTNCTLGDNITLTGNWTPIGTDWGHAYTGTFDGGKHTISGLSVSSNAQCVGMFGCIGESGGKKGTVQNLTLVSPTVSSTNANGYVGAVAGINAGINMENCHVEGGSVTGNFSGGVVGVNESGSITACYATGTVSGDYAGGVVGVNESGSITACYATGTVSGDYAGGVVGVNGGTVTGCYATGEVKGDTAGGVVGVNGGTVTGCYATGEVKGDTAGGVVGYNDYKVTACYATGTVTSGGLSDVGGVVGSNLGIVTACYATGDVTSTSGTAGGVVGSNYNTVTACYWSGKVNGLDDSDQGIGKNYGTGDAKKVTSDGDNDADDNTVSWDTAKNNLNSQSTGYIFGGDMNNPTLTKK